MNRFVKNMAIMSIAPIFTQTLSFMLVPIITRYYTPDDFAMFSLYGSLITPFAVFANLGYGSAIVSTQSENEASNLFTLNIFSTILFALLSFSIFVFFNEEIASFKNYGSIKNYFWLIPISILIHGFYIAFRSLNIRFKGFNLISSSQIGKYLSENCNNLIAAFTGYASGGLLIIGGLFGGISSLSILSINLWAKIKNIINDFSLKSLKHVALKYSKFPKYILPVDFVSRISEQLPIYLLAIYFSQSIIGFYALGLRLLTMPISLIGGAIGDVFFQEASSDRDNISNVLEKIFYYLALFATSIFLFIGILGEEIFYYILGNQWGEAGIFSQILSLYLFSKFITIPASYLMIIYEKQEYSLFLNLALIVLGSISLVIGGLLDDVYISLILFSILNSIVILSYGIGFMKYSGIKITRISKILAGSLIKNLPLVFFLVFFNFYTDSSYLTLIICIFVFLINILILILTNNESKIFLFNLINKRT